MLGPSSRCRVSAGLKRAVACARALSAPSKTYSQLNIYAVKQALRRVQVKGQECHCMFLSRPSAVLERVLDALVTPGTVTLAVKCQEQVWYLALLCDVHPTDMCEHLINQS